MADRRRTSALATPHRVNGVGIVNGDHEVLTSSARFIDPGYRNLNTYVFQYERWQDELWDYLDTVGEFGYGSWWRAQAISRVRLIAAEKIPGVSEPKPIETGQPAELMAEISTSENMEAFGIHVPLVGKCFLLGQDEPVAGREWSVKSADEIRRSVSGAGIGQLLTRAIGRQAKPSGAFELQVEQGAWQPLVNALVSEIKHDHPRYGWRSVSVSKSAIPILREIALYDKHIIATLVSRIAMNGMIFFPEGMTFPVNPQFKDAADPFIAEWIEIASRNIRNPGQASAALPYPIRVNEKFIELIKHFTFATPLDPKIIAARAAAITRLATSMNISRERITGLGAVNHWGMAALNEDEVNTHIVPTVELIAAGLTKTYLRPMLAAAGQPLVSAAGNPIIAWYDAGELTANPDLSANAQAAYRDGALKRLSYLKYMGFEDTDLAEGPELEEIILIRQALAPGADPTYLTELFGTTAVVGNQGTGTPPAAGDQGTQVPPGDQGATPATNVNDVPPSDGGAL